MALKVAAKETSLKMASAHIKIKNTQRTFSGFSIKVKFKTTSKLILVWLGLIPFFSVISVVQCNRAPRFLIDGQTEIVLRLKEGNETQIGKLEQKLVQLSDLKMCVSKIMMTLKQFNGFHLFWPRNASMRLSQ